MTTPIRRGENPICRKSRESGFFDKLRNALYAFRYRVPVYGGVGTHGMRSLLNDTIVFEPCDGVADGFLEGTGAVPQLARRFHVRIK